MNRLRGAVVLCLMVCCVVAAHFYFSNQRPTVSVVMSTYNRADRLERAVNSVLNQTFKDFEFIIINDGSADNTTEKIRAFRNRDRRIIFLNNEKNKGLIYSLNRGLNAARGRYIARIDDDDEMLPQRLEKQVAYMEKHPEAAVLATGYYAYRDNEGEKDGKKTRRRIQLGCPNPHDQVYINMHFGNGVAHPTTMLRLSFLKKKGLGYNPDYKSAEDYKLWTDVIRNGGKIHCLGEPLTEYTRAGDNPSSFYTDMSQSSKQVRIDLLSDFFDNPQEMVKQTKCYILTQMVAANRDKKILNQERLERGLRSACPKSTQDAWLVTHPYWTDYFIFTDNGKKLHRFYNAKETATVDSFNGTDLVVKWDGWPKEKFTCDKQAKTCVKTEEQK